MTRIEEIIQQQIIEAWNNSHLKGTANYEDRQRLYCIYNNSVNGREGNKMRSMGVRKGATDLAYVEDNGLTHYVELKTDIGVQSDDQKSFQNMCIRLGAKYSICRSYSEFWLTIGISEPQPENTLLTKMPERLKPSTT